MAACDEKDFEEQYIQADELDMTVTKQEIQQTKKIYGTQCKGLTHKEEQKDLWKTLTVARKNKLPLLTLVIDAFTRDRMDYYLKTKQSLQLQQWSNNYPTLKILSKEKRHQDMIQAAVQTFFHRYSSMIQLPVMERYDDSIEAFTNYIIETTSLINIIISRDLISPPFQIDLIIIPQRVVDCSSLKSSDSDEDESEDDSDEFSDDDSDSDSDSDSDGTEKKDSYDPFAQKELTDSIKQKLESVGNIIYEKKILANGYRPRLFHDVFKDLKQKLDKLNKTKKSNASQNGSTQTFLFPHKERLCIVLDRRKGQKLNELFIYKPNLENEFPESHVTEWYFQSSFTSIIPGKQQNDTVTAKTSARGYVFCLSFQIEQKDVIRSYLYTRSQMIRFLPDDIHNLLPFLFVVKPDDRNSKFIEKEKKCRAKSQKIKLIDTQFDKFRADTKQIKKTKTKSSH